MSETKTETVRMRHVDLGNSDLDGRYLYLPDLLMACEVLQRSDDPVATLRELLAKAAAA